MSIAEKTTPRQVVFTGVVVLVVVATAATVVFRLGRQPETGTTTAPSAADSADDSLLAARDVLYKAADPATCRTAVEELNRYLDHHPDDRPVPFTNEEQEQLAGWFDLDPGELAEVASPTFTNLDAHHLDTCLLLHDAGQGLDVSELPPAARAEAAFEWVMRQVRFGARPAFTAPPAFVLRRGWGNALERSLVFLSLLPQLGLDGCLVACPRETESGIQYRPLLGVLVQDQVLLFDPYLGMPLPGPGGKGVATLRQVRAKPEVLRQLNVDANYPYDVTPAHLRRASLWVPCSLSSLSARIKWLESELAEQNPVKLSADPAELLNRFKQAVRGQAIDVGFWSRSVEGNAPTAVLRQFLPPPEGGVDRANPSIEDRATGELFAMTSLPQVVTELALRDTPPGPVLIRHYQEMFIEFPLPQPEADPQGEGLVPADTRERDRGLVSNERAADRFLRFFLQRQYSPARSTPQPFWLRPESLRDDMLRGRLNQATTKLVEARDQVQQQQALLTGAGNLDEDLTGWIVRAQEAQVRTQQAQKEYAADHSPQGEMALQAANQRLTMIWQGAGGGAGPAPPWLLMLFRAASEPLGTEATYLLALCKQEEAERWQRRLDTSKPAESTAEAVKARTAWESAVHWWETYLKDYPEGPSVTMARELRARALEHLGQPKPAAALLRDLSDPPGHRLTLLEKTARLYQAHRLEQRPGR
jgi:hypothetical protein